MSLRTKWCSGFAVAGVLLLVASCAEGPTLPPDDAEVGPLLKKGGGPPQLRDVDVEIPSDYTGNALIGDDFELNDGLYEGGKCAVVAKAGSSFSFFPFYGAMNGKERKDYEGDPDCRDAEGSLIQRWMRVDLANAKVHTEDHVDEPTLAQFILDEGLPEIDIGNDDVMNHAKVSTFDVSGSSGGSFGVPYCNYLQFNDAVGPNDLLISQDGSVVHVRTQDYPNNVGLCAYDVSGEEPLWVLLHLDIAYDVKDKS